MPGPSLLLVEDEKALLSILTRYLERGGYCIASCERGQEALDRVAAAPDAYDAIILDLNLPDLPGEEVLRRLLETSSRARILVSSGQPFSVESVPPRHRHRVDALLKPFLPKMLEDTLRDLVAR
jgi:DNA-binding response OmpR family regulator